MVHSLTNMPGRSRRRGVNRVNISIDSLDPERFTRISRVGKLDKVLAGIEAALRLGRPASERIRLNSVIMRGYNEDEVSAVGRLCPWTAILILLSSRKCPW